MAGETTLAISTLLRCEEMNRSEKGDEAKCTGGTTIIPATFGDNDFDSGSLTSNSGDEGANIGSASSEGKVGRGEQEMNSHKFKSKGATEGWVVEAIPDKKRDKVVGWRDREANGWVELKKSGGDELFALEQTVGKQDAI